MLGNKYQNHVGTYDFSLLFRFERFRMAVSRQFLLEDTPNARFGTPWDGMWGAWIDMLTGSAHPITTTTTIPDIWAAGRTAGAAQERRGFGRASLGEEVRGRAASTRNTTTHKTSIGAGDPSTRNQMICRPYVRRGCAGGRKWVICNEVEKRDE